MVSFLADFGAKTRGSCSGYEGVKNRVCSPMASGKLLRSLLGGFLGGLVFQNACEKYIETHVFKNMLFAFLHFFEAFLVCSGGFWVPEWSLKVLKNASENVLLVFLD